MRFFLALLFFVWGPCLTFAAEKKFFLIPHIVEPGETLDSIYVRFARPDRTITPNNPAYLRTLEQNPEIKDWTQLVEGKEIKFYIGIKDLDRDKYKAYFYAKPVKVSKDPKGLKGNLFYVASTGKFTQSNSQIGDAVFYQNSPITIGTGLSYYPKGSLWSFSSSLYVSYLQSPENNQDNKKVDVPPEIGGTLYAERKFRQLNFTPYSGIDYEKFSTFNLKENQNNREVLIDRNTIVYLTLGLARSIEVFKSPFFTKMSFARSLLSNIDADPEGIPSSGGYDGYRFLWSLNKKISDSIFIHSLFKYHWMSGPLDLTTLRAGIGFGYIFL